MFSDFFKLRDKSCYQIQRLLIKQLTTNESYTYDIALLFGLDMHKFTHEFTLSNRSHLSTVISSIKVKKQRTSSTVVSEDKSKAKSVLLTIVFYDFL